MNNQPSREEIKNSITQTLNEFKESNPDFELDDENEMIEAFTKMIENQVYPGMYEEPKDEFTLEEQAIHTLLKKV